MSGKSPSLSRARAAAILILLAVGPAETRAAGLTYSGDIEPILSRRCVTCHVKGGAASRVNLSSWEGHPPGTGVVAWLPEIARVVTSGEMPPTLPAEGHAPLVRGGAMSATERWTILSWLAEGGAAGPGPFETGGFDTDPDEAEPGPGVGGPSAPAWPAGPPDIELAPPESHHLMIAVPGAPPSRAEFPLKLPNPAADLLVQGYDFAPGPGAAAIASIRVWIIDAKTKDRELLGQWNPGAGVAFFPPHCARLLPAGCELLLEARYATTTDRVLTRASAPPRMGLYLAGDAPLRVETLRVGSESGRGAIGAAARLLAIYPNGRASRSMRISVTDAQGSRTLIHAPKYDCRLEAPWRFDPPVPMSADAEIVLETEPSDGDAEIRVEFVRDPAAPRDVQALVTALESAREADRKRRADSPPDEEHDWEDMQERTSVFRRNAGKHPSRVAVVASHHPPRAAEAESVFWCPNRAECGIRDYEAAGVCEKCGRDLVSRSSWLAGETARTGAALASRIGEWRVRADAASEEYLCPNRGDGWHRDLVFDKPGFCGVCGARFVHRSRFERVPEFVCTTWGCRSFYDPAAEERVVYRTPGLCPDCGMPTHPFAHMDHSPVHGGQLMMAASGFHHVEATLPRDGGVRVYVSDDYKTPVDARNFAGRLILEEVGGDGTVTERRTEMEASAGGAFLSAVPEGPLEPPVEFAVEIDLAGMPFRFQFLFEEFTPDEPAAETDADSEMLTLPAAHGHAPVEPVVVPEDPHEIAREIIARRDAIRAAMDAGDFAALENPARETVDLAQGLVDRLSGEAGAAMPDRAARIEAARQVRRAATALVRYSHLGNRERIFNMGWTPLDGAVGRLVPLAASRQ